MSGTHLGGSATSAWLGHHSGILNSWRHVDLIGWGHYLLKTPFNIHHRLWRTFCMNLDESQTCGFLTGSTPCTSGLPGTTWDPFWPYFLNNNQSQTLTIVSTVCVRITNLGVREIPGGPMWCGCARKVLPGKPPSPILRDNGTRVS